MIQNSSVFLLITFKNFHKIIIIIIIMKQQIILLVAVLGQHEMTTVSSFAPLFIPSKSKSQLSMVSREDYLKPQFHATAEPGAFVTEEERDTNVDMTRVEFCADSGGCDLEEMSQLLQDLERIKDECSSVSPNLESTVEDHTTTRYMDELGYQIERSMHLNDDEEKKTHDNADLKQHLRRMHEIANYEEH